MARRAPRASGGARESARPSASAHRATRASARPSRKPCDIGSARCGRVWLNMSRDRGVVMGNAYHVLGDPVGTATVLLGFWLWRQVQAPFSRDWLDLGWRSGGQGVWRAAKNARLLQTGRVRDYALALALGLVVLLLLGWGISWR